MTPATVTLTLTREEADLLQLAVMDQAQIWRRSRPPSETAALDVLAERIREAWRQGGDA